MKVILDDEVFREGESIQSSLIDIISFGYYGKHDIITEPLVSESFEPKSGTHLKRWLDKQTVNLSKEVKFVLEMGIEEGIAESRYKDKIIVELRKKSNWKSNPPKLTVNDASTLLSKSLHILVENSRSDGQFVKTMIKRILGKSYWMPLKKAIKKHWLHIENGGGIGNMKKVVAKITNDPIRRHRTSAVFDSDASVPGEPSDQSEALREACQDHGIDCWQLRRRAIENYLPREALKASVDCGPEMPSPDRDIVDAFCDLNREQRHHFHMKSGFNRGDSSGKPPELFIGIDESSIDILEDGFNVSVADIFCEDGFIIEKSWIEKDYSKEDKKEFEEIFNIVVSKI